MRIDFGVGHVDVPTNFAFTQARFHDLDANFIAKFGPANAVLFGQAAEFGHRQAVFIGDTLQCLIERVVIYLDAGFFRLLNFYEVKHHAV